MFSTKTVSRCTAVFLSALLLSTSLAAESLPSRLQGTWRITRVLPTSNTACWGREQAEPLVGSTLTYREDSLRWRGGSVPLNDIVIRNVSAHQFSQENNDAKFGELGIRANSITEVDLQHEDMDITGATTEVPGDSVLLAGPNRIVVQACGVFFEAMRSAVVSRTAFHR